MNSRNEQNHEAISVPVNSHHGLAVLKRLLFENHQLMSLTSKYKNLKFCNISLFVIWMDKYESIPQSLYLSSARNLELFVNFHG